MGWKSVSDLIVTAGPAPVGLVGAPMEAGSVTPGRCDLAPDRLRQVLRRFSTYDLETRLELELAIFDRGDIPVTGMAPADGLAPIRDAVRHSVHAHALTLLIGGNNAVTRPAVHGLADVLEDVGLITIDAHFDLRDTDQGLLNGNPVRALLEDGLPGANICQIGLAPFANTGRMHRDAEAAGIGIWTIADCRRDGIAAILAAALRRLSHLSIIAVDFDIDVIDRSQFPGAPGARPGGMKVEMFFEAARLLAREEKVRLVDLTEYDPSLDASDLSALTAGRWMCEILSGFAERSA